MKNRATVLCIAAATTLSAPGLASAQAASKAVHYTVVVAEDSPEFPNGRQLCNEMAANLNSIPVTRAPVCERPHNRAAFSQFTPLRWRFWSPGEFMHKWIWLNRLEPDLRLSTANASELASRIERETFGVSEVDLPAPIEGQAISAYIRVGIPDLSLSPAGRKRHDELLARLRIQPIDYPLKLSGDCGTADPISVAPDKSRADDSMIRRVSGDSQLWVYRPSEGASFVFAQYWINITPGFQEADLVNIDPEVCQIHYSAR